MKRYFLYIHQIINRMATTGSGNMGWEYRFVNLTKRQASDILYKIQKYFMINKRLRHFKADFLNQNSQLRLIMTLQVRSLSLLARGFTQKYQSIYVRSCMNLIFSNKLAYQVNHKLTNTEMSAGSESDLTKRNSEVFETHTSTVKSLSFA